MVYIKRTDVGPFFCGPTSSHLSIPQEGSQHQSLSGFRNKAVILHKGVCANEYACSRLRGRLEAVIAAEGSTS